MPRCASALATCGCSSFGSATIAASRGCSRDRSTTRSSLSSASHGSCSETVATHLPWQPMSRLRCVFYDPDAVDAGSHLSERAFEACARAEVEVFALAGDEPEVDIAGERHDVNGSD